RFAMLQIDQAAATAAKNTVAMPIHIAQATRAKNRWSLEMRSKRGGAGSSGALCAGERGLYSKSVIVRVSCRRN
ncbi:hypothetical protein DAM41_24165, partial [Salmonella enterica subsp. enterica serovar Enteritidis]|nr:hypothetical protein [Salmonella enterica subsp. enterica serovar Enteritidis]